MYRQLLQNLQEEHIETTTVEYDNGTEWILDFYLQSLEAVDGDNLYGVKIHRSTTGGLFIESDETFTTIDNRDEALAMVKNFAKGKVLPISLFEVVEDWEWQEDCQLVLM